MPSNSSPKRSISACAEAPGSGKLRRSYVPGEDVEAALSGIQARRRVQWQRELRTRYLEEARPSGGPSVQDVISGDATAERFAAEGNPAEAFARRVFGGESGLDGCSFLQ
jgi:hypothetical protein